jgi:anti-sigma regulatory factor (Ser/Thr protein kinase)
LTVKPQGVHRSGEGQTTLEQGPTANQDDLALPADPSHLGRARSFIDATAAAAGFGEEERYQITMAVNEAVANALEHGVPCRGGTVHLGAEIEAQRLSFYVRDCGEFALVADPHPGGIAERGRGFALMHLLMDDVQLQTDGQTEVRLSKRLEDRSGSLSR